MLDIAAIIGEGELTVTTEDEVIHLDYNIEKHGIVKIVESLTDPQGSESGTLFVNKTTGDLFFDGGAGFVLIATILKKDGVNVISKKVNTPPLTPSEGDQYIIPVSASGEWEAYKKYITRFSNDKWYYVVPSEGQRCGVKDEYTDYIFTGSTWLKDTTPVWVEIFSPEDEDE